MSAENSYFKNVQGTLLLILDSDCIIFLHTRHENTLLTYYVHAMCIYVIANPFLCGIWAYFTYFHFTYWRSQIITDKELATWVQTCDVLR